MEQKRFGESKEESVVETRRCNLHKNAPHGVFYDITFLFSSVMNKFLKQNELRITWQNFPAE